MNIKRSAIPLSGYVYQNLVGLNLLCDWLDNPALYEWVQFEADHDEVPQGLDDVVAQRRDTTFVLFQVKFTVDANDRNNTLTWNWLLAHRPAGRSLLQKWCDSLFGVGLERVHTAALITNRIPSRDFDASVDAASRRVNLNSVDPTVRTELLRQLGSVDRAEAFFNRFEFCHSYQGAQALERTLVDRFVPRHTDRSGWLSLFREAIDWAVRCNFPPPRGQISLDLVRGTLNVRRPRPLEQSFRVPDGYQPPDAEFASEFLRSLGSSSAVVLWGSPGQGKSTFLSYVCRELEQREVPFIRHHYFLDLGDRSDRFTLASVANSLIAQMEAQHFSHVGGLSDRAEHLRAWIEACARGYHNEGKRFLVVIDGLDHVWRENDRDKRPLDSLFTALLPVPDNVTLVIGTQKVSEQQLPSHFNRFIDSAAWIELPRMSLVAIESWLRAQYEAERFETPKKDMTDANSLVTLAIAFQRVTGSHPLVLTYCFEALARQHRVLEPSVMDSNTWAPDGDIKKYYTMLWQRLPLTAKDALHLLADAGFIWPALGLESCLRTGAGDLSPAIGHLLHNTEAGQVAFHGSLYAFVRDDLEHDERIRILLPNVVEWLRTQAPAFHRWGWLWLYEARTGDSRNLLEAPDRNWAIESLASAYPQDQIEAILTAGEQIAFENANFAKAIQLRWLKARLHNGPEFQLDDYDSLHECALQLTEDEYPLKTLAAGLQTASVNRLHLLGRQYLLAGRTTDATECMEMMRRRINDRIRVRAYDHGALKSAIENFLELAAGTRQYKPDRILAITRDLGGADATELTKLFLRELAKGADLAPLMEFVCQPMLLGQRRELELACLRLAGALRAKLHEWPEFARFSKHPMSWCWRLFYQGGSLKPRDFNEYDASLDVDRHAEIPREAAQRFLHRLFFSTVARCMSQRGAPVTESTPHYKNRPWFSTAAQQIMVLANSVGSLLARRETPAFALPFRLLDAVKVPESYEAMTDYIPFRNALTTISGDLFLLTSLRSALTKVPSSEWARANSSNHFESSDWCNRYAGTGLDLLDRDLIGEGIGRRQREIATAVSPFNDRMADYLELCQLATRSGLHARASELLRRSMACVVSYGWRKDPTIGFVIDSVEAISSRDRAFATDMLRRLIPIVVRIDDMTEDAGARPSDLTRLIITLAPETFAAYYNHWLLTSKWYTADLVFAELLAKESLDDPAMSLVTSAVWDSHAIGSLRKRADEGDGFAAAIIVANEERLGLPSEHLGEARQERNSSPDDDPNIDVSGYSPSTVESLLQELRSRNAYVAERRVVRKWFQYWLAQRCGMELLRSLEPYLSEKSVPTGIADVLDLAFEASLQLEGKGRAYRWLVAAQVHRRGWDEYYDKADVLRRFSTFACHYKAKWRQFISETTKSMENGRGSSLSIPHHRLVHFLLAVDEAAMAKTVVEAMVSTTIEDFAEQPLVNPAWLGSATP
ncbi:MAG: ATP-binding protein [Rhodocyclaceae bacterium]|nr:ATP-binding protein [Rhodocyclaceae bacterium]MBX3667216.1 ATP-binding protein [Rhodocyclaceae bacterium]